MGIRCGAYAIQPMATCAISMYSGASGDTSVRDEGRLGPSVVKKLIDPYKAKQCFVFYICDPCSKNGAIAL